MYSKSKPWHKDIPQRKIWAHYLGVGKTNAGFLLCPQLYNTHRKQNAIGQFFNCETWNSVNFGQEAILHSNAITV